MKKKIPVLPIAFALFVFSLSAGCKKTGSSSHSSASDNCAQIQKIKITGSKGHYTVGDTIKLATNVVADGYYTWTIPSSLNSIAGDPTMMINSCTKYDEGWYYLTVSNPGCDSHTDSLQITVTNKVVAAPCSPADDEVTFSLLPDLNFSSTTWQLDPSWGVKNLSANAYAGPEDFNIYFNPFWNTKEPEDGEYEITNTISFDNAGVYTVFIASTYSSIYFQSYQGSVFISHVNGKIRATFCSVSLSGDNGGPSYQTTANGQLTGP